MTLLGIPLVIWGLVCLAVAVIWVFVWPSNKSVAPNSLPHFILRWAHALVWLFLAAAAFIAGFDLLGGANTAQLVALLALLTYLLFMATLVVTK
jgi:hypothetical protein